MKKKIQRRYSKMFEYYDCNNSKLDNFKHYIETVQTVRDFYEKYKNCFTEKSHFFEMYHDFNVVQDTLDEMAFNLFHELQTPLLASITYRDMADYIKKINEISNYEELKKIF